jgi:hypothetical protein
MIFHLLERHIVSQNVLLAERLIPKHGPDERSKHMKRWDELVGGYIGGC